MTKGSARRRLEAVSAQSSQTSFGALGWRGEVTAELAGTDCDRLVEALAPEEGSRSVHWGRNFLYLADLRGRAGTVEAVVKQFRHDGWRRRLDRRYRRSKAERSWRVALAMVKAGIATPEPLAWVESETTAGVAYYASRVIEGAIEARGPIKARNDGRDVDEYPDWPIGEIVEVLARCARRLHDAGFWHRDYSAGNVLMRRERAGVPPTCYLVDLNRCRVRRRVGLVARMRDLCRMPFERREDQRRLLAAYFGGSVPWAGAAIYRVSHAAFHGRHRVKRRWRRLIEPVRDLFKRRSAYAHIPPADEAASRRDRAVWDHLSDQPHQHAGRFDKMAVRCADLGVHVTAARLVVASVPKVWSTYRSLLRQLYTEPILFGGLGVCVSPWAAPPERQLAALEELGLRHVLLRLHPWEEDHDAAEHLAAGLAERGYELVFSLPQQRELVKDPERWRRSVETLSARFLPYGRRFVVGQAINRSKWGVWTPAEFDRLARVACEELRRHDGVEVAGPGVIDFEPHQLAALLDWPGDGVRFDAVASLLYVDRRGAPEKRQLGFDTVRKAALFHALALAGRRSAGRSWITEVNWPLLEGPHAPAGRHVAVDEETAASFTVRYYLLTLATGLVERVYFWQLTARGYGLMVEEDGGGLRQRPAFRALAELGRRVGGATFLGPEESPEGARLYAFRRADGSEIVVGWAVDGRLEAELTRAPRRVAERDGDEREWLGSATVEVIEAPRYFELDGLTA